MYYGQDKIQSIETVDGQSVMSLDSGVRILLSEKMAKVAQSKSKVDATKLRDLRCFPVIKDILSVLKEWDVKLDEVEYIFQSTAGSLNNSTKDAQNYIWQQRKPGINIISPVGFMDLNVSFVDEALKERDEKASKSK